MNKFYILQAEDSSLSAAQWATVTSFDPPNLGDRQKCPVCGKGVTGRRWLPPHLVKLSRAKPAKWADFTWGPASSLLVSARFKQIYEQEGLTGISAFSSPVEIVRLGALKNGQFPVAPPTYHLIHVLWGGANQDDAASGVIYEQNEKRCPYCRTAPGGKRQERVVLEAGSWNGKDMFIPRNAPVTYMVSDRFKQVVQDHSLTNAGFVPAGQYGYDSTRWGKWYVNGMPELPDRAENDDGADSSVDDHTKQNEYA